MTWPTKTDFVDGDVLTATQVNNIGTNLNLANPTGITDGYVLTADGAGSMGWEAVDAASYTLITSGTITSTSTVTISSITQDYRHLELWLYNVNASGSTQIYIDGTDTAYPGGAGKATSRTMGASSTTVTTGDNGSASYGFCRVVLAYRNLSSGYPDNFMVARWLDYSDATANRKHVYGYASYMQTGASNVAGTDWSVGQGNLTSAAAIQEIQILATGATMNSGNYKLWGIK